MKLSDKLKKIDQYIGTGTDADMNKFNEYYAYLVAKYPSEKTQIDDYIESSLRNFTTEIRKAVDEIGVKVQRMKVSETVSMSY